MQNSLIYYQAEVAYRREHARQERRGWFGLTRNEIHDPELGTTTDSSA